MKINDETIIIPENTNLTFEGVIKNFTSEFFTFVMNEINSRYIKIGQKVDIKIYNNLKGEFKYTGTINKIEDNEILINNLEKIYKKQRRREVRVDVIIPAVINRIFSNDNLLELEKSISGDIVNLSASGFFLKSEFNLSSNIKFLLILEADMEEIEVISEVVRKEEKDNLYFYGCKYETIDGKDEKLIRQFIYEKQIEEIRKKSK